MSKVHALVNVGNTCYLNSVIQSILSLSHVQKILAIRISQDCDVAKCIAIIARPRKTKYIESALRTLAKIIAMSKECGISLYEQSDAHEAYIYIMGALHRAYRREWRDDFSIICSSAGNIYNDCVSFIKKDMKKSGVSMMHRMRGYTSSVVSCERCDYKNITHDPFYTLTIYPSEESKSIRDLLRNTLKDSEPIPDYKCETCNEKNLCSISRRITVPPACLMIHVERMNDRRNKNKNCIDIESALIIDTFWTPRSVAYKLKSVIHHFGTALGGHYSAQVLRDREWFFCDDHRITKMSSKPCDIHGTSYALFYEMCALPR